MISNEDYLLLINRLNDFADNTFTFGESILKKMEDSGINDRLKLTAEKVANKGAEFSNSIYKRTRESITSINQSSKMSQFREKATGGFSAIGGKLWGYFGN